MKKCPSSIQCWDSNPGTSRHESPPITTRPGLLFYFLVDQNHLIIPLQNIQKSFQSIGQLHFGQSAIALNPVSTNNFQPIRALQNECFLIFYCKYLLKSGLGDVILGCPPPLDKYFFFILFPDRSGKDISSVYFTTSDVGDCQSVVRDSFSLYTFGSRGDMR